MFFLGKVFKVRGKIHGDEEKPFLDHLEDLRSMVTKIVLTLLVSTVLCWVFHKELIKVLSEPVHEVWETRQDSRLPDGFDIDQWEEVKQIQAQAIKLPIEQRKGYFAAFGKEGLEQKAKAAGYFSAAMQIPDNPEKEKRLAWAKSLEGESDALRSMVVQLIEKEPAWEVNAKSKVVDMKSLKPTETFMLAFKLAFYAGLTLSFPLNLWFVMQFVIPGLRDSERKVMWPALAVGFGLFLMGVLFSYFVVLPRALDFFFSFGTDMGVQNEWRIGEYISFVTQFTLIFGLAFELPVLVMTLVKMGLVGYQTMSNTRTYAVLAICVTAALITPTGDVLTLSMLAIPMYILYEICIILAYFDYRKQVKRDKEEFERTGVRKTPEISAVAGTIAMDDESHDAYHEDEDHDHHDYHDDHHDHSHYHHPDHDHDHYHEHDEDVPEHDDYAKYHEPDHYYSDEGEVVSYSESEGDEGDSDSYEDNVKAQQETDSEDSEETEVETEQVDEDPEEEKKEEQ